MAYYQKEEKIDDIAMLEPEATYSYADYLRWTFQERVELIKGKIFRMAAAPASKHQRVLMDLSSEMHQFFKKQRCKVFVAPFDVRLTKDIRTPDEKIESVIQPDICIICDPAKLDAKGCVGAPDLIAEILSPSTSKKDLENKYELYQESAVKEYLIVYPFEAIIDQHVLKSGKYHLNKRYYRSDSFSPYLFPDLKIEMSEIFDDDNQYQPGEHRL